MGLETYSYSVTVLRTSAALTNGPLSTAIPGCGVMTVQSSDFKDVVECERALTGLLSMIGTVEAQLSSEKFVILTKLNPLLDPDSKEDKKDWTNTTVLRAYVANATELKQSNLKFQLPLDR